MRSGASSTTARKRLARSWLVLARQAVDDVDVDVAKADGACLVDEPARLRRGSGGDESRPGPPARSPARRPRARGSRAAANASSWLAVVARGSSSTDRRAVLATSKVRVDRGEQAAHRVRRQEVRRAAAERDLGDRERRSELLRVESHLGREHVDVDVAARHVARRDDVAAAVPAQALAERDVDVQRGGAVGARPLRARARPSLARSVRTRSPADSSCSAGRGSTRRQGTRR